MSVARKSNNAAIIRLAVRFIAMRGLNYTLALLALFSLNIAFAQVTGGESAFEYLRMSNSPHVSALGGISIADPDRDISLAVQNPAMMREGLHNELGVNYNSFYSDIKIMNLQYGYYLPKLSTAFFADIQYLNYGSFTQTDNFGNSYGDFHAVDYALTLGASRSYLEHWRYGAAIKYANSSLYTAKGSAVLVDVGINYFDTANLIDIGAVAKNMGAMTRKYTATNPAEPVPFDLQLGISKKFKHMPLRLFATIHHLYQWDIRYDNPVDDVSTSILGTSDTVKKTTSHFADKLFRHFIFGGELSLGKRILLTVSYNDLRRSEMVIKTKTGATGFAFGVGINLTKFQIHYARSFYHIEGAYNEIGINFSLNKLMKLGKYGDKIYWNNEYADWE